MTYFKASLELLVEADGIGDACDAVSEALRPLLRTFEPTSSVIDWRYADNCSVPEEHNGSGFEYADEIKFGLRERQS
jgi:hypothetical protein